MTRSLVSQATTTTLSVTQSIVQVRAMTKYNEDKQQELQRVAQAMEEQRQERLRQETKLKGKFYSWCVLPIDLAASICVLIKCLS